MAAEIAEQMCMPVVVKAQVLTGGRKKAGGVSFADNPEQAAQAASEMLGQTIGGFRVQSLLVEQRLDIQRELYMSVTLDKACARPILMLSLHGGIDIEEVADELIVRMHVDPLLGMHAFVARDAVRRTGLRLDTDLAKKMVSLMMTLYSLFEIHDADLVEINPLVVSHGELWALDAKITIDDSALFRQQHHADQKAGGATRSSSFVKLDGDIGVIANGAGITMATLDTIAHFGGRAANFLDVGGGAAEEQMAAALDAVLALKPKSVLINIFGGITRCDDIAAGIAKALDACCTRPALAVRLVGTNQEEGRRILHGVGMIEAVKQAIALAAQASEVGSAGDNHR